MRYRCPHCGRVGCRAHGRPPGRRRADEAEHRSRRKAMLLTTPEVCGRCGGGPRWWDPWEAGHIVAAALGGGPEVRREHRSCNRKAGGELGVALRKVRR
jgi:hypothetical protein